MTGIKVFCIHNGKIRDHITEYLISLMMVMCLCKSRKKEDRKCIGYGNGDHY